MTFDTGRLAETCRDARRRRTISRTPIIGVDQERNQKSKPHSYPKGVTRRFFLHWSQLGSLTEVRPQPKNPRFAVGKLGRLGKTVCRALSGIPNQELSVAPYWSMPIVGIQRPRTSVSSGPPNWNAGNLP